MYEVEAWRADGTAYAGVSFAVKGMREFFLICVREEIAQFSIYTLSFPYFVEMRTDSSYYHSSQVWILMKLFFFSCKACSTFSFSEKGED